MKTFSGLGIGLSLVFGFLLLALVAEVYYLLRWKKNKQSQRVISQESEEEKEEEHNGYAKDLIQLFCFKKPQSLQPSNGGGCEIGTNPDGDFNEAQDLELGLMKHLGGGDAGFEAEFMKLHNQRFLFTIKEETKEDLESEDGKSRTRSLSDLALGVNECHTPSFFTPLASPTLKESYPNHGFNPLFESEGELEFNRFFRPSSSPPPKFKFLRDAEEKLRRRLMEEAKKRHGSVSVSASPNPESSQGITEGSFLKFMNREKQNLQEPQHGTVSSSSSLQVQQILER